ncbi:hypothetical protein D9757_013483 [Collybiopsis confluens]|uniref:Transmembrane protein n=1 Tax=Collybiopsis confluens TaxID=2823264 RepID=A0A8H5FQI5_9AGAR|nr:hypothetical protein D9757_013483 [Collybiopsis confluens]
MDLHVRSVDVTFPTRAIQVMSYLINIFGIAQTTHYLSRRISKETITSWSAMKAMSWARMCILVVFLDSWCFFISTGILLFGVGLESNDTICAQGIDVCIAFYASSKIAVYFFLIEKVYVVWSPMIGGRARLKSPVYIFCLIVVSLYAAVVIVMIIGRLHFLRQGDGVCFMGLKPFSSWAILGYDIAINIVLTMMFLWPLLKAKMYNERLRRVAFRTLIASAVGLTSSSANTLALAILKGREEGWLCLGSCSLDIICNASAIFWITRGSSQSEDSTNRPVHAPDSRLESGRLTFNRNHAGPPIKSSHLFGRDDTENIEMQRGPHARATTEISVNDLIRAEGPGNAKPSVQVTVTTQTIHDGSMKGDFFSDDAINPLPRDD